MNSEQLTSARLAEIIGVQPSGISHILSGRNKPGFDFIQKILGNYPSLNAEWLIMGRGMMYKQEFVQGELFADNKTGLSAYESDDNRELPPGDESDVKSDETGVTNVNSEQSEDDYIRESDSKTTGSEIGSLKKIDRIVVFYDDMTFSSYSPGSSK